MLNPQTGVRDYELWLLLAPPLAFVLLFLGGFFVYMFRTRLTGIADSEMRARGSSILLGAFSRDFFVWLMAPLLRAIVASRVPANAVTAMALLFSVAAGVALGLGHFGSGGWLFLCSGFLDYIDGRVARLRGESSASGALLDSVFDRYAEGAVFIGLAWFYRENWVLLLVLSAALGSQLVSYTRSRCGDLGVDLGRVGLLQRPERIASLGAALCFSPILAYFSQPSGAPEYLLAIFGIGFLAITTNITAIQRLIAGMKILGQSEATQDEPAIAYLPSSFEPSSAASSFGASSAASSFGASEAEELTLTTTSITMGASTAANRTQVGIGSTCPIQASK